MTDNLFPHGRCECNGLSCCHGRGPAAFRVTRDGRSMLVCTRCDFLSDQDKVLLVTEADDASVYMDFDPLGGLCLAFKMNKEEAHNERSKELES